MGKTLSKPFLGWRRFYQTWFCFY